MRQNRLRSIDDLPDLPHLVDLDLYDNLLAGLPTDIGTRFPSLKTLDISFNCLTSADELAGCTGLDRLYASNNYLSNVAFTETLHSLRVLEVGNNKLLV